MPTVSMRKGYLLSLLGADLTDQQLRDLIESTKMEVEEMGEEELVLEVTADRIDMLSPEGIARYLRGIMGAELGMPRYRVVGSAVEGWVEESVLDVRPAFALAVVRGVKMTEDSLISLMRLQEKLDEGWGRGRRKVSIGIHDLEKLSPPVTYRAEPPEEIVFVPLRREEEMDGRRILRELEKGREYGHIISWSEKFPVIRDSEGRVISMPPIINSEMTRVTEETRDLLIDVTGLDQYSVEKAAVVIATSLAELGGSIELVRLHLPGEERVTPDMEPLEMELDLDYFRRKSGIELSGDEVSLLLRRCRLDAEQSDGSIRAVIPPFRVDFLHPIDLVEEALIAYGYWRLKPEIPTVMTMGRVHPIEKISRRARILMIGLGYQEVLSYIMTNPEDLFDRVRRPRGPVVEVANPVSATYSVLRDSLIPGLLLFLARNVGAPYPQKVFEVGDVVIVDEGYETRARNERRLAAAIADDVISFEHVQSHLFSLLEGLGLEFHLRPSTHPTLIEGRTAEVIYELEEEVVAGIIGEVRPDVLESLGLRTPVGVFEVSLEPLVGVRRREGRGF